MSLTWHTLGLNKRSIHRLCLWLYIYVSKTYEDNVHMYVYMYTHLYLVRESLLLLANTLGCIFIIFAGDFFLSLRLYSERLWIKVYFWVFIITLAGVVVFVVHFLPWRVVVSILAMSISLWGIKAKNDLRVWWLFVW